MRTSPGRRVTAPATRRPPSRHCAHPLPVHRRRQGAGRGLARADMAAVVGGLVAILAVRIIAEGAPAHDAAGPGAPHGSGLPLADEAPAPMVETRPGRHDAAEPQGAGLRPGAAARAGPGPHEADPPDRRRAGRRRRGAVGGVRRGAQGVPAPSSCAGPSRSGARCWPPGSRGCSSSRSSRRPAPRGGGGPNAPARCAGRPCRTAPTSSAASPATPAPPGGSSS